jgi:hypothetical protein
MIDGLGLEGFEWKKYEFDVLAAISSCTRTSNQALKTSTLALKCYPGRLLLEAQLSICSLLAQSRQLIFTTMEEMAQNDPAMRL